MGNRASACPIASTVDLDTHYCLTRISEAAPSVGSARGSASPSGSVVVLQDSCSGPLLPGDPPFSTGDHSFGTCLRRYINKARESDKRAAGGTAFIMNVLSHRRRAHHVNSVGTLFRERRS